MSAILEAYWHLAAKRFVDNACMLLDERVMGELVNKMQEHCYGEWVGWYGGVVWCGGMVGG